MFVFKAAVLGAGTMGGEIAQVIAAAEVPVVMKDVEQRFVDTGLEKAREVTQGQLASLVGKEKITQEEADAKLEQTMDLISGATDYDDFGDVDFVVEAVPERMELKQSVFGELDEVTPGHAVLASNTSALSISEIAGALPKSRRDKVVGFHFFYPASVMRLIEVVEGSNTSEGTAQAAANFAMQIRKNPIRCGEAAGFVVNRVLNSAASEIWRYADETGASVEEVDKEIAEAKVTPMGPFFLSDLLGLDTVLHVARHLRDTYGDRFYVHPKMEELVEAGNLGQKTGQGYYSHGDSNGG
jgi:3-hydroxyacyl-CoA dehydrogenase